MTGVRRNWIWFYYDCIIFVSFLFALTPPLGRWGARAAPLIIITFFYIDDSGRGYSLLVVNGRTRYCCNECEVMSPLKVGSTTPRVCRASTVDYPRNIGYSQCAHQSILSLSADTVSWWVYTITDFSHGNKSTLGFFCRVCLHLLMPAANGRIWRGTFPHAMGCTETPSLILARTNSTESVSRYAPRLALRHRLLGAACWD